MIEIMSTLEPLLAGLKPTTRNFAAGEYLFHRGDAVGVLHVVREGEAHLVRHQAGGAALVLQRAGPGAVLAEASLFSRRYHCDAIAATPLQTQAVRIAALLARLREDGAAAQAWLRHLAGEMQAARQRAEMLALRGVRARLDAWLAGGDGALPAKGAWKALAAELAVTPEALYREIARRR